MPHPSSVTQQGWQGMTKGLNRLGASTNAGKVLHVSSAVHVALEAQQWQTWNDTVQMAVYTMATLPHLADPSTHL